jgi:hypothetical protein
LSTCGGYRLFLPATGSVNNLDYIKGPNLMVIEFFASLVKPRPTVHNLFNHVNPTQ